MKSILRLLVLAPLVVLLGCAAPSTQTRSDSQSEPDAESDLEIQGEAAGKLSTHRFRQEKYRRRYRLYTPVNADKFTEARPLVLVIHGGGSTDRGMIKLVKSRWNELADENGFYVVYPNAVDKLWDFGEGRTSRKLKNRVDDLAYFQRVLDDVADKKEIDQNRIFATGISRGGQSSYFLACNIPNRIRAIMPVAMSIPDFMEDECRSGPPVGIAIVNGTTDPQVPYDGGWITVFRNKRDIVLSTNETLALWRKRNECSEKPTNTETIDKAGDNTSVDISDWSDCDGAPVKLYKVNNGGHTWPSGVQYLGSRIVGETSYDINAAEEGWAFFSQF